MKLYQVTYNERGSWGYYRELECVVTAENEAAAIKKANMIFQNLDRADCWKAEEIKNDVHYISSSES